MAGKMREKKCACGCGKSFQPKVAWQMYINLRHKNRAGQKRLRQRAKEHGELSAALNGGIGNGD